MVSMSVTQSMVKTGPEAMAKAMNKKNVHGQMKKPSRNTKGCSNSRAQAGRQRAFPDLPRLAAAQSFWAPWIKRRV